MISGLGLVGILIVVAVVFIIKSYSG